MTREELEAKLSALEGLTPDEKSLEVLRMCVDREKNVVFSAILPQSDKERIERALFFINDIFLHPNSEMLLRARHKAIVAINKFAFELKLEKEKIVPSPMDCVL